jgi:hypothetical protein
MADCSCTDPVPLPPRAASPLYAYEVSPEAGPNCSFVIPPMTVFIFPFWLCPDACVEAEAIHTAPSQQDHSLRLWLAKVPLGNPVILSPAYLHSWEASRVSGRRAIFYDTAKPAGPPDYLTAKVAPGPYLLHVQNLTNFVNRFSLRLAQTGVEEGH